MTTFILEPLPETLETLWRGLDRTGEHSYFLSWPWIGTLIETSGMRPHLLKVFEDGGLVGLALLTLRQGRLRHVLPVKQAWLNATGDTSIDSVTIEHNGFALRSGHEPRFWPAFIAWFARERFADELVVPGMAEESVHGAHARLFVMQRLKEGYRTPLAALGPEGITSAISGNARQQLRRSMRDYDAKLSLDRAPDTATALAYFDGLKQLHIRSWTRRGRTHAFADPYFETFHRALIAAGMAEDNIDLLRIRAGDRVVGYLYNFRRNGTVSSYQSGFDDENRRLRPGYVCHALAMAHYAQAGEETYDFLAGANRLKQSFGTERYALCWRHYRKPTIGFRAEHAARKALHLVRRRAAGPQD